jgi:hypothetical protein
MLVEARRRAARDDRFQSFFTPKGRSIFKLLREAPRLLEANLD